MNEENKTAQAPQPGIQIIAQYIKDFSFENPNAPESLVSNWGAPETSVNVSLQHGQIKDNAYECVIKFKIEAKKKGEDKTAFIIDLAYAAVAVLQGIPKENHQPVLMVELPKLLFPFAREIVASSTAKGGYPPLYLTPINFEALYVNEIKRLQAEKGATKAAS